MRKYGYKIKVQVEIKTEDQKTHQEKSFSQQKDDTTSEKISG